MTLFCVTQLQLACVTQAKFTFLQVTLLERSLWDQFNKLGTEMIITKAGR